MRSEQFSIGDRVEYVSPDEPEYDGLTGTIEEVDMTSSTGEEFAYVIFDNEMEDTVPLSKLKPTIKGINEMKKINESSRMTDQDLLDWIGQEVSEAEWCTDMAFDDHDAILEVEADGTDRFEIIVKPMEGGEKEDIMLEDGNGAYGVPEEVKSEIMTLINEYAEYFVRSITDDNFPDVKVNKKKQELFGLIESL